MSKKLITLCAIISMLAAAIPAAVADETDADVSYETVITEEIPVETAEPNVITDESLLPPMPSAELNSDMPDGQMIPGRGLPLGAQDNGTAPDMITSEAPADAILVGVLPFQDVAEGAWYYDVVSQAYNMRLISGVSNTEFAPENNVTGAQLLMMLYRAAGYLPVTEPDGKWYDCAVDWAKENNVLTDNIGWAFNPEENLTREQMMVILYNYMMYRNVGGADKADLSSYTDSSQISSWAYDAVAWLVGKRYIQGSNNALRPLDSLTRAESCVILVGAVNDAKSAPQPTAAPEPTEGPLAEEPELETVQDASVSSQTDAEPEEITIPEATAEPAPTPTVVPEA